MKKLLRWFGLATLALICLLLVVIGVFWFTIPEGPELPPDYSPPAEEKGSISDPELRAEFLRMYWLDQAVRDSAAVGRMTDLQSLGGIWRLVQEGVREQRVDGPNVERVKEIIAERGWPTRAEIGTDGLEALFMIVQHATFDQELQQSALPPLRDAYEAGSVSGSQLALLTDRVRLAQGQPQLYGTQLSAEMGQQVALAPIEDEQNVDERRAELGLSTLAVYLVTVCEETGVCVER